MALKTSLVITGDSASATAALAQVEQGLEKASAAARRNAAANDEAGAKATVSTRQAAAGYVNLGRQVQDVTVQLQGGANIGTIIAQQGGQVADAVAQMGGKFAGFASFMAGPVGSIIIVTVGLLANQLIPALFGVGEAADDASSKNRTLVEVLDDSASSWEQVTAAARDYAAQQAKTNETTLHAIEIEATSISARLQSAIAIRKETQALLENAAAQFRVDQQRSQGPGQRGELASLTAAVSANQVTAIEGQLAKNQANIDALVAASGAVKIKVATAVAKINSDPTERIKAGFEELRRQALASGASVDDLTKRLTQLGIAEQKALEQDRKSGASAKRSGGRAKAKSETDTAGQAGGDIARRIAAIGDQFSDLPAAVARTNSAMRELDKITGDIERKKPFNAKGLLEDIGVLKGKINESLNKPFSEYLEKAQQAAQIDQLLLQGKYAQAEALQVVLGLEKQQVPLSKEQLATVLATVEADRARSLVLRDQQAIVQGQVRSVQDVRGALEETVADALRGKFSIGKVLSSLGNSYINLTAQKLVESLFGNTLRSLEEQASGSSGVKRASDEIAGSLKAGAAAVTSFADVVGQVRDQLAGGRLSGGSSSGQSFGDLTSMLSLGLTDLGTSISDTIADIDRMTGTRSDGQDIVVTAARSGQGSSGPADRARNLDISGTGSFFVGATSGLLRDIGIKLPTALGDALSKSLTKLEKGLPQALAGAFTGASASRILLGDRGTGGTIGAAIGGALGGSKVVEKAISGTLGKTLGGIAGPLGSIVGGLLGGLIGGLFQVKPRGSGTVTQSAVKVSANKDSVKDGLNTLGGNLQNAVQTIADKLGGAVGNYEVGIGQYKDYYQVSNSGSDPYLGQTFYNKKSPQALYDGKDAAAALSAAISNAVADGAIEGISSRVAAALKSSSDIDKALREALKVQDLELALGGIGEELRRQFAAFEQQAKERLRIAGKYGFDVVAVEKRNAEDRIKLQEKLAKQQIGSLQQLIDDLTAGSLFEGSAIDQRAALQGQIAKARADTNAGVEGAADTLNSLLQQFNTVSKDAFGTTGGFAADRQAILDIARDSIAKANQRVTEAQKVTDPALAVTNAQLNESNDQLARIAASMNISVDLLRQMRVGAASGGFELASLRNAARI